jgi:hypothetical protein
MPRPHPVSKVMEGARRWSGRRSRLRAEKRCPRSRFWRVRAFPLVGLLISALAEAVALVLAHLVGLWRGIVGRPVLRVLWHSDAVPRRCGGNPSVDAQS